VATQKELEALLVKITDAGKEARETLSEMHGERKALIELRKAIRGEITEVVTKEVHTQLETVARAAKYDMSVLMVDVIGKLEHDWREKLGL